MLKIWSHGPLPPAAPMMRVSDSLLHGTKELSSFVLEADDLFTISDYQLLCLVLKGLHQHIRKKGG